MTLEQNEIEEEEIIEKILNNIFNMYLGTVGGQIKLGHLKFNLCKSDH
jgi:hypothetical protein